MATNMMTLNQNDPQAILEFALGPIAGAAALVPQQQGSSKNPELFKVYHKDKHSYVLKKGMFAKDDWRCFDAHNGKLMWNSHHPGKDPYEAFDPLGLNGGPPKKNSGGIPNGEWESICDVTGKNGGKSFEIRPKQMSMHGRQYIRVNKKKVLSVAKMSKLKTMSLQNCFALYKEEDSGLVMGMGSGSISTDELMTMASDMYSRTIQFKNKDGELIALAQKPPKTLILNYALGKGSEMQLDIAPGVDCSAVIATFFAVQQVGESIIKDALGNFVMDPLEDEVTDQVTDAATGFIPGAEEGLNMYKKYSNDAKKQSATAIKMFDKFNKLMEK